MDAQFAAAAERAKTLASLTQDEQLHLYKLFKQVRRARARAREPSARAPTCSPLRARRRRSATSTRRARACWTSREKRSGTRGSLRRA